MTDETADAARDSGITGGEDQPDAAGEDQPDAAGEDQPDAAGEEQPDAGGEEQPDAGGEEQPDAAGEAQPDAAGPVRTLDPRVRWLWIGQVLLGVAVVAAVGTGLAMVVEAVPPWLVAAVVVPLLVLGLAWAFLRYRLWAFQFRADHLFLERGVYRNVETVVPYVRIQHVDTSRGPVERVLGLSTLVVYTAGSRGADVAIPGLPADEAEAMQTRVKELAIAAEGGEGL